MTRAGKLDVDVVDALIDKLRYFNSPSMQTTTGLIQWAEWNNEMLLLKPAEYAKAKQVYARLYASRKERNRK